ncbi:MAG TPA: SDR family NAD(P)-dependent oxidoreductase [Pyrinomonadaceae bacterium]|nr:SDR family NAD(P)-dependent oxidoreductase [Pyrinomonadaceae bacterium]
MEIEGKRVLITGAGRGLGRALVTAFVDAGAGEVIAGARKREDREVLQLECVTPLRLDVTSDRDVEALETIDSVDILINNAGVAGFGNPLTMDFAAAQEEMAVNYFGVLRVSRAIAPGMIAKRDGVIVNIATAFAKVNLPIVGTYCATKAALLSLGQAMRAYLSEHNVRVITVMPTTIDTDMSKGADVPKMTKEFVAAEILAAIREERHDPPIGEQAAGVFEGLSKDPVGLEKSLQDYRM